MVVALGSRASLDVETSSPSDFFGRFLAELGVTAATSEASHMGGDDCGVRNDLGVGSRKTLRTEVLSLPFVAS